MDLKTIVISKLKEKFANTGDENTRIVNPNIQTLKNVVHIAVQHLVSDVTTKMK
jgi:hypothetical protein